MQKRLSRRGIVQAKQLSAAQVIEIQSGSDTAGKFLIVAYLHFMRSVIQDIGIHIKSSRMGSEHRIISGNSIQDDIDDCDLVRIGQIDMLE